MTDKAMPDRVYVQAVLQDGFYRTLTDGALRFCKLDKEQGLYYLCSSSQKTGFNNEYVRADLALGNSNESITAASDLKLTIQKAAKIGLDMYLNWTNRRDPDVAFTFFLGGMSALYISRQITQQELQDIVVGLGSKTHSQRITALVEIIDS